MSGGGAAGNERLTATTGVVLLVLLAVEGVTILSLRTLLPVHIVVGMALIPPVALKLGSTGWRFARYYLGTQEYRLKGPPHALLRFLVAPIVVWSTLGLFGTGVALLAIGPDGGIVLGLHKVSFVVWVVAMAAHVLAHAMKLPRLTLADYRTGERLQGARRRVAVVVVSLAVGALVAGATYPSAAPWLHQARHHDGRERG